MKKVVLKLDFADDKTKQKVMKKVSGLSGLESITFDQKDKKLTVTGDIDPVDLVAKVKKICSTDIVTVGPAKEPEKKKDEPKKEEPKKDEPKKDDKKKDDVAKAYPVPAYYYHNPYYYNHQYQPYQQAPPPPPPPYYQRSVEEDPNSCVIC